MNRDIEIYTDGSCRGDGNGGYGWVAIQNNLPLSWGGDQAQNTTNNKMEMLGFIDALLEFGRPKFEKTPNPEGTWPIIYTDSTYVYKSVTEWIFEWEKNDWIKSDGSEVKNKELMKLVLALYQMGYRAEVRWLKGHEGTPGNEIADKIATGQINSIEEIDDEWIKLNANSN